MTSWSYPLRHISIRVPWHDSGWEGTICRNPKQNTACLKLVNIANSKDEGEEQSIAGQPLNNITTEQFPPCVTERASFMAPFPLDLYRQHPYARTSPDTHSHFKPTQLSFPAYGAAAVPYRWMMKPVVFGDEKQGEPGLINNYPLEIDQSYEPQLNFDSHWIQDHRNHRALLDCFWNHVQLKESLVFFYAKQVPLVDDTNQRVLIGAGRVLKLGPCVEYDYVGSPAEKIRSLLWERMVTHSIRPEFKDGFLLPYQQALAESDEGRAFDPAEVVAFAPENRFTEFSYATEHVSHDAAIESLISCRSALLRAGELFNASTATQENWIDQQLGRLWKNRGPFPGMGAVLGAMGVPMSNFITQALVEKAGENGNPWEIWKLAIVDPSNQLPNHLLQFLDNTILRTWQRLPSERQQFLELLSRIDLSADQAELLAVPEMRTESGINVTDSDYLNNPYIVYESTRLTNLPVDIGAVDRGIFPTASVRQNYPLTESTVVRTTVDGRRLRALVIRELERAAVRGDTLLPQETVIINLRARTPERDEQHTPVTADSLTVAEDDHFSGNIRLVEMSDGKRAYQLERLVEAGKLIVSTVTRRTEAMPHNLQADWRVELDRQLPELPDDPIEREKEEQARQEKAAALNELATRRFSVLVGRAGTGKTTLLSVLCSLPAIYEEGILMLAPTGKARVRMEDVARHAGAQNTQAFTLAQFLSQSVPVRYDSSTRRYRLTGQPGEFVARTVIVDECSMLTEEMAAALLEALSGVHRLIFAGDPRQLPPIGAGRPFVDIITHLCPDNIEARFPRVSSGYAELTIPRRQSLGELEDLQLAAWFSGCELNPGEDKVFEILSGRRKCDSVKYVTWETVDEIEELLPNMLAETLGFDPNQEEWQSFALSLGAKLDGNGSAWYNVHWSGRYPNEGSGAERWQVLSPVRQKPWGVDSINRVFHLRYKGRVLEKAKNPGNYRSIPPPMGDHQIVYGDKVINNRNTRIGKKRIYPTPTSPGFLANGEIGTVVGSRKKRKQYFNPALLEIEFSTQVGQVFKFWKSYFGDDRDPNLELAYALTVHKAQGSEFDVVFLILPRSNQLLTRELLYTALTRQKQKVVLLHQGSPIDLQRLTSERYSATAVRLTNLFFRPQFVEIGERFLEKRLIHCTSRGEAVRSKSEVIIANLLHENRIDYHYEQPLELDDVVKYPDFTIEDDDTGETYYWEHCGMLSNPEYRQRWEEKKNWYRQHKIHPIQQGGGERGTLIVTEDRLDGGIDSLQILAYIEMIAGP